ncbi:uncharacterized protein LOC113273139 [Papaver somniferum]|uniref:uncharacterized protein LOC113273139 n=1 Tax=Papaver somniferum TaxID=3469 RepID=UPI000E6F84E6|nr:uncharacterized protein LOC113273139 [Papaver somniferum]
MWSSSIQKTKSILLSEQSITIEVGDSLVTGIHAASLTINRRSLWNDLVTISKLEKPWLVMGDFNTIMSEDEKKGGLNPLLISMLELNNCLHSCGLIQAPKNGMNFSWCNNRAGRKRIVCNLDKTVFNDKWLEKFSSWGYKVGSRGISDHSTLYGGNADIPKPKNTPFRALKSWETHTEFLEVITNSWEQHLEGNPIFVFMSKVIRIKSDLKEWNWSVFGDVNKQLKNIEDEVLVATAASDNNPSDINLLNKLVTVRGKQEILLQQQREIVQQKSRVIWLKY